MQRLVHQVRFLSLKIICVCFQVELCDIAVEPAMGDLSRYSVILDALFGFSFKPPIREPYDIVLKELAETQTPIACVDIPSGWDVEKGPPDGEYAIKVRLGSPCAKF